MARNRSLGTVLAIVVLTYLLCVTSAQRRRWSRPGSNKVNILFVKASSVKVGFNYVQEATRFEIIAREWVNGKFGGNIAARDIRPSHARESTLRNLNPGREYLIQVQAFGRRGKVGNRPQKVIRTSQQCYTCNAKDSNEKCKGLSAFFECPHDKDACLNEVRYSRGIPKITKRCAQWRPELGKRIQNGRDVTRACSGRENIKDVACKCMCRSNLCNEFEMPCLNECFSELPTPPNSYIRCSNSREIGSVCTWYCISGYKPKGTAKSTCRRDRTWSVLTPPECVLHEGTKTPAHTCPVLEPAENVIMTCTNENKPFSKCSFTCVTNYRLKGSRERVCDGATSKWTGTAATCEETTCSVIEEVNGLTKECSNGEAVGSVCEFSCSGDKKFVGERTLTCLSSGRWSSRIPRCTVPDCSILPALFPNVILECGPIPNRATGKICSFSCEEGYRLSGSRTTQCTSGNRWTNNSPTCIRIKCRPSLYRIQHGFSRCSNRDFYGSTCSFFCADGYMIRGVEKMTCGKQGRWSAPRQPTCQAIRCPPIQGFNGLYSCNNGQNFGSVCRFSCRRGFGFQEGSSTKLECVSKSKETLTARRTAYLGRWDKPVPKCIVIGCPPLGPLPDNASKKCTTRDNTVGTVCTYLCDPGYQIMGSARTTCTARTDGSAKGDWSHPQPVCERVICDPLPVVANGDVGCSDGEYAGSECAVSCDYGYNLAGRNPVRCSMDGFWSRKLARCSIVTCSGVPRLTNGRFLCGDLRQFNFNHECQARCNPGFEISESGVAVCGVKGSWLIPENLKCIDEDECEQLNEAGFRSNGGCEQNCVNTIGSYRCTCEENYVLEADGRSCRITICPELEAIQRGRISCTNSNNIGSRCSLRCIPGFEVTETARINCLRTGIWNDDFGSCQRISCPPIEIPSNSIMSCNLGFQFGSECEFKCIKGFELRGSDSTKCGADEQWTSSIPSCHRKRCEESLLNILNANVDCSNANKYESLCIATCDIGYRLDGLSLDVTEVEYKCQEDQTWGVKNPNCVKKRCQPSLDELSTTRKNGIVTCKEEDFLGSICTLKCDEGYEVVGEFQIRCVDDAVWNRELGFCRKVKCPTLLAPEDGGIKCTEGSAYLSSCSFACGVGYKLNGSITTECKSTRRWTERTPTCDRIECLTTFLQLLKGTVRCSDGAFYGSECEYRCDPGYVFADTVTSRRKQIREEVVQLKCSVVWSDARPECERHECLPPSRVMREAEPNGNIQCSNGDKFESICELSCEEGYEVRDGRPATQCLEDKNWSPKLGQCTRIRCPMFAPLINGGIQCTNANFYESQCRFACYAGYRLVGSSLSVCRADKTFSNDAPTCEKIECPENLVLANGTVTCSDGNRFQSECVLVCKTGFEMVYSLAQTQTIQKVTRTCLASGAWRGRMPICRRKICSFSDGAIARARLNGKVTCTELNLYLSRCVVNCPTGFKLVGFRQTICLGNSDWSNEIGHCERILCPSLRAPQFGTMGCTNENKFESVCSFKCNYGYELIGAEESTCLASRSFSHRAPFCREILCPISFLDLANAEVTCSDQNKLDSQCDYECDDGYRLTETSAESLICQDTYKWNGVKPACEKKTCPKADTRLIQAAEHGTLICSDSNKFQSICSVQCFPGYRITEGGAFTECRSDQKWGPRLGYCIKIICEEFAPLDNGAITCTDSLRYQSVCSFSCEPGYELTHDRKSTCQADRTFSEEPPQCIKITCSSFHLRIFNGKVACTDSNFFASVCTYECDVGFERVTGSETAECLADRTWSARKTGCERIICDGNDEMFMTARTNGEVTCTGGFFFGSSCSLMCDSGYELSGVTESKAECEGSGQWIGQLGTCTRVICRDLLTPKNGSMSCSNGNVYESVCTFACDSGFERSGERVTECQADRSWTNDEPTCEKIECSSENLFLDHGTADCTEENKYLSVCSYECNEGYEMDEEISSAMCMGTRAWTRNKPTCIKKICDFNEEMISRASENGKITCTDESRYQSVCSLECDEGYELVSGSGVIECTSSAKWSEDIGYCQKIICTELIEPDNGAMDCTDANRYRSVCTFECDEGYEMDGSRQSECLSNRSFTSPAPRCLITQCPVDHLTIEFGGVKCTDGNNFQSVCEFECLDGYEMLIDETISECRSNQSWTIDVPICEKTTCPYDAPHLLKAAENGTVDCTEGNRFGSICSVECRDGYELSGHKRTECSSEGTWTQPLGYCKKIECDDLPVNKSVNKFCTDGNLFNSSCTFSCDKGYVFSDKDLMLEEEVTMTCDFTETWTAPGFSPECTKTTCPDDFLEIVNGNVRCTDGTSYRSQCLVQCDEGYELEIPADDFDVTTIVMDCLANSTWSVPDKPVCKRISCFPDLEKDEIRLAHGKVKCTYGSDFQSTCTLTCNDGYEVTEVAGGDGTVTQCQSDGAWTPLLGFCRKISCPPLTAPDNSSLQCSDQFKFKSSCQVICRAGYEIYNPENDYNEKIGLECKANGEWCGDLPTCQKIQCPPDNLHLEGGTVSCSEDNYYESECRFTCDAGYQMTQGQSEVITCTPHQSWSSPTPTCQRRRCPANDSSFEEASVTGQIVCSDENKFDSDCELQCAQGFELTGLQNTTCHETGKWSNGIGLCNKIRCGEVKIIDGRGGQLRVHSNADIVCSDGDRFESFCTFTCKSGYMPTSTSLKAGNGVVCTASGLWEGEIIKCEKITCPSLGFTKIEHGRVSCNDSNHFMSRCLFDCDGGYELENQINPSDPSSGVVNCTETGLWDVPSSPKCKPIQCDVGMEELQRKMANGIMQCTDEARFESKCSVTCLDGYQLVGNSEVTCGSDRKWGPELGNCQKKSCQALSIPENGRMACDDEFKYMSQCVFDCLPGYRATFFGKDQGVTTCKADGGWIGRPPTCEKIRCDSSYLTLRNGKVTCTEGNAFGSECEFNCEEGYELQSSGQRLAQCQRSGIWSMEKPFCRVKTCESAFTSNGITNCTGTMFNAFCRLTCEPGYRLVGASISTCTDSRRGKTEWEPDLGKCEKKACQAIPDIPHGSTICSDGNRFRSSCNVVCGRGYRIAGKTQATQCMSNSRWSRNFQTCQRVTCDTSYLTVDYGSVEASDGNNFGSTLKYSCPRVGHRFNGAKEVTCLENGQWSRVKPRCRKLTCPAIHLPKGRADCSGKYYADYQSRCTFSCEENYQKFGSDSTECQLDRTWTNPTPYCKGHCDVKLDTLENGQSECTNSHFHHSRCSFQCKEKSPSGLPFVMYGNDFLTCKSNGRWDGTPPCCTTECIPNAKMDLFFVFHSTRRMSWGNWKRVTGFAVSLVNQFHIGTENVLVGAVRYHRDVDAGSEIPIGRHKRKADLLRALDNMKFGGWGNNVGEVLSHVARNSISKPGNRPDVSDTVILVVDEKSTDSVTDAVEMLKKQNVTVYVLAIQATSKSLSVSEVTEIASRPTKHHVAVINSYERLSNSDVSENIAARLCKNPCLHSTDYLQRAGGYRKEEKSSEDAIISDYLI